jgi:hypothetical protein
LTAAHDMEADSASRTVASITVRTLCRVEGECISTFLSAR